jgi:hypothetical protein
MTFEREWPNPVEAVVIAASSTQRSLRELASELDRREEDPTLGSPHLVALSISDDESMIACIHQMTLEGEAAERERRRSASDPELERLLAEEEAAEEHVRSHPQITVGRMTLGSRSDQGWPGDPD